MKNIVQLSITNELDEMDPSEEDVGGLDTGKDVMSALC